MKKLFFLIATLLISFTASAQVTEHKLEVELSTVNELTPVGLTTKLLVQEPATNKVKYIEVQDLSGLIGGNQDLQEVTDIGNTTTNTIITNKTSALGLNNGFIAQNSADNDSFASIGIIDKGGSYNHGYLRLGNLDGFAALFHLYSTHASNTDYYLPVTSGTFAFSATDGTNNVYADENGFLNLSTLSLGGDLQAATDNGNTTTNEIVFNNIFTSSIGNDDTIGDYLTFKSIDTDGFFFTDHITYESYATIQGGNIELRNSMTEPSIRFINGSNNLTTLLRATNATINRSIYLPDSDGTLAMEADASGFDGNLTTTDNTLQEIAQKFDDFVGGGGAGSQTTIADAGASIDLTNPLGTIYNMLSANSNTAFTTSGTGGWAKVLINAATEPTVDALPGPEIGGTFIPNTDIYLIVYTDAGGVKYYWSYKDIGYNKYPTDVSILDFVDNYTVRSKILSNDDTVDSALLKIDFDEAFAYCIANGVKKLKINSGTYVVDKVTIDNLDDFILEGDNAIIKNGVGNAIFQFTNSTNWEITGITFTSNAVAYADVSYLLITTGSGYFNIHNCSFTNMPRTGIRAATLGGGTFTYGIQVHDCLFLDTPNYSNDNQCGIELANDGEYSKIHHNIFQSIPSAIRMVDGANSEFSFNTCMQMNGDAYDATYTNAVVYCEEISNSGKIDILYNKINHNDTGIVAIVCKGDITKPTNAFKVIGNDILVNANVKNKAIYLEYADNTPVLDNKLRGRLANGIDTAITVKDSDNVILNNNYILDYATGIELINSANVRIREDNIFEGIISSNTTIDGTSSLNDITPEASDITNTASGNLTSTDVQSSLVELQGDIDLLTNGFQGDLKIADTPTVDGYYFATESGTYTNAGSVVVDLSQGLNIITKESTNYAVIVVPFSSGGILKREDALSLLNSTPNTVLSIPFFDTNYVSNTTLTNSVGKGITFSSSSTDGTVADGKVIFDNVTRYESSDVVNISRRNSYYCMAFTDMGDNNTDRGILGYDVASGDYMQIRLGAGTLNIIASGGTFDLPVGFDKLQPFVLQIVNTADGMNAWINGEQLNQSNAGLVTNGVFKMNTIGRLTTAISRVAEGGYVYMKASNTIADRSELNKDLLVLSNMMGITPAEIIDSPKQKVNVLIWAGQSNADGRGAVTSTARNLSFYSTKEFNVNTLDFDQLRFIYNSGVIYMSPLQSFANIYEKINRFPLYVVKQAVGGTSFSGNDWNQGNTQYVNLLNKFNYFEQYAQANNIEPNYIMVWIQGESDGDNTTEANAYETALTNFISDFRTDTGLANLPFVIGRLSSTQTSVPELSIIQTAEDNVEALSVNNYIINTNTYASDGLHFTETGNIDYGVGIYNFLHTEGLLQE